MMYYREMFGAVRQIVDAFMRRAFQEHDDIFNAVVTQYIRHRRYLLIAPRAAPDGKRTGPHSLVRYAEFLSDTKRYIDRLVEMRANELDGITREVYAASYVAHLLARSEGQPDDIVVSIQSDAARALDNVEPRDLMPPHLSVMEYRASIVFNVLFVILDARRALRQIRNEPTSIVTFSALNMLRARLSSVVTDVTWLVESVDAVKYPCLVRWGSRLKCYVRKTRETIDAIEKTKLETPE